MDCTDKAFLINLEDGKTTKTQKVLPLMAVRNAREGKLVRVQQVLVLVGFVSLNLLVAFGLGRITAANRDWADHLIQPSFRPPSWIFAPMWTLLYIMIGFSAWRIYTEGKFDGVRLAAYVIQLAFNFMWTPIYFGWHQLFLGLIDIVFMWISIVVSMAVFMRVDKVAALLLIPYLMWVSFATILNGAYWWLNFGTYKYGNGGGN